MGFFSWKTQDTNKSIANSYSDKDTFTVHMKDDKGNIYTEYDYDGYGIFGSKDYYELLAEMNGKKTRDEGISLQFSGNDIKCPNLSEDKDWSWRNEKPEDCNDQGFFYE